jgi:hypothetical protein
MNMTRQHFQLIADVLREWSQGYDQAEEAKVVAELFADQLTTTNPSFDRDRFIDVATGVRER